jgi:DNA-directed RNA polymerase subunit E'/Rpb7
MKNRRQSRFQPTFSPLEDRAVPAVTDPVGTFAVIDGKLSPTNQATAPRVNFDFSLFRFTRKQVVSVKVQATASDGGDLLMGPAVNNGLFPA